MTRKASAARPLHERIRDDIEARILSGALAPGDRLPTETELCAAHACARMTVSKALQSLAAAGMIERRKKAGSFVARPRTHAMVLDVPDLQSEVRARGSDYAFALVSREVRPPLPRSPLEGGFATGSELLVLSGVHAADGRPFAFEERAVDLASVPQMRDVDFSATAPGTWLLEHVPWTEAETRITAAIADARIASLLALDRGAPLLVVERRTWRGSDDITSVRQSFDAASYDLQARFSAR